jgi:hypothetical protein
MSRRWSVTGLHLIALSLGCAGCQSTFVTPSSDLKMSDSSSGNQLISGFYAMEEGGWRWTKRVFAVVLQPPAGSERTGATLHLQMFIPPAQIEKLGPMTLNADIDDISLGSQTFNSSGHCKYTREIPPALIHANVLPIVFSFDKVLDASATDGRELAAVVTEVALERKN